MFDISKAIGDFMNAAKVVSRPNLWNKLSATGKATLTGNSLRQLDFVVDGRPIKAIQQNPDKLSGPGLLAKKGHEVVQIKDVTENRLLGAVDATDNIFIPYGATGQPVTIDEIEQILANAGVERSEGARIAVQNTGSVPQPPPSGTGNSMPAQNRSIDTSFLP